MRQAPQTGRRTAAELLTDKRTHDKVSTNPDFDSGFVDTFILVIYMNYIKRSIEDLVKSSDKTFKCVLVTGARQTGKSTMLKALFPDKKYVPIDDPFIEDQANENPNMFMMLNPPPAFYDEVQRAPGLFRFIKIKCDESDKRGQFCLSGSQPLELMESASESLSGRVSIIELAGLSLREIQGPRSTNRLFRQWSMCKDAAVPRKHLIISGPLSIAEAIQSCRTQIWTGRRFSQAM